MGAYRGHPLNFLGLARRLSPVSAHNLSLSLGEGPRRNAKALKCNIVATEGIQIGDSEVRGGFSTRGPAGLSYYVC